MQTTVPLHRVRRAFVVAALIFAFAGVARAEVELSASLASVELDGAAELGVVAVGGVGPVALSAERQGLRLLLTARDADGAVIGRAESTVGLDETPIAVLTPTGTEMVRVRWAKAADTSGPGAASSEDREAGNADREQ